MASCASVVGVKNLLRRFVHEAIIGTWPSYRWMTQQRRAAPVFALSSIFNSSARNRD
jgi:hypothetical protein